MSESGQKARQNRASGLRRRIAVASSCALAVCSTALLLSLSSASGATSSALTTKTFLLTNGEQIFKVPDGVTSITVTAVGGKGANGVGNPSTLGGFGASATAALAVTPGQVLFVNVGGNGGIPTAGFNGGGAGGNNGSAFPGGGGGGATDLRTNSSAMSGNTLVTRLVIAGGGGGSGGGLFGGGGGGPGGFAGSPSIVPAGSGTGGTGGQGAAGGVGGAGATRTAAGGNGNFAQGGGGGAASVNGGSGGGGGGGIFGGGGAGNGGGASDAGGGAGAGSSGFGDTAKNTSLAPDNTGVPQLRITYNATSGGGNSGLVFGKVIKNKKKGTALLPVTVPGSGTLSIGGKGVVKKRPALARALRLLKDAPEAGTYKLKVKAKGFKLDKLEETGKVKVKTIVTFEPSSGDAVSASKKIKLKEN
jgi:hypothetical protein